MMSVHMQIKTKKQLKKHVAKLIDALDEELLTLKVEGEVETKITPDGHGRVKMSNLQKITIWGYKNEQA